MTPPSTPASTSSRTWLSGVDGSWVSMTERPQLTVMSAAVSRQASISWASVRKAFSEGPTPPSASQCSTIIPRPREAKSSLSSLKEAWKASGVAWWCGAECSSTRVTSRSPAASCRRSTASSSERV